MNGMPPVSGPKGPERLFGADSASVKNRTLIIEQNGIINTNTGIIKASKEQVTFSNIKSDASFSIYIPVKNYNIDIIKRKETAIFFEILTQDVPADQKPAFSVSAHVAAGNAFESFGEEVPGWLERMGDNKYTAIINIPADKLRRKEEYKKYPKDFHVEGFTIRGKPQFQITFTVKKILAEK